MDALTQFAINAIQRNPQVANTPQGQQFLQILQSGNVQAGQAMASNIVNSWGLTPQQAIQNASRLLTNQNGR